MIEFICIVLLSCTSAGVFALLILQDDVNQSQMRLNEIVKQRIDELEKRNADK